MQEQLLQNKIFIKDPSNIEYYAIIRIYEPMIEDDPLIGEERQYFRLDIVKQSYLSNRKLVTIQIFPELYDDYREQAHLFSEFERRYSRYLTNSHITSNKHYYRIDLSNIDKRELYILYLYLMNFYSFFYNHNLDVDNFFNINTRMKNQNFKQLNYIELCSILLDTNNEHALFIDNNRDIINVSTDGYVVPQTFINDTYNRILNADFDYYRTTLENCQIIKSNILNEYHNIEEEISRDIRLNHLLTFEQIQIM